MTAFHLWKSSRERRFHEFVSEISSVRKILVLRNGLLGDVVFITPVIRRFSETFPEAIIDVMVSEKATELLKNFPSVRKIYGLPEQISLLNQIKLYKNLRAEQYDLFVIQETNTHYAFMSLLTGAKFRVGFQNSVDVLLHKAAPWYEDVHCVVAEIETVNGWTQAERSNSISLHLSTSSEEQQQAKLFLKQHGVNPDERIVCFHPGCSDPNSVREWIVPRYSEVADQLAKRYNAQIIFTGIGRDRELTEAICKGMKTQSINLAGKTSLRSFMAILEQSSIVIGSDTGALHIATALGTPVVMLMGYTGVNDTGPFDSTHRSRVVRVELPCSPCIHKEPKPQQWESCKNTRPVLCMEKITSEAVLNAVKEVIDTVQVERGARLVN